MVKDHIFIVFGAEHYNPLTVIRSLGKNGINPVFIAIKNKGPIASKSRYIEKCHHVESIEEGYDVLIREYGELRRKPFLLTTDDDVQSYLDSRYTELANRFYFFNAGKAGRITEFMDKKNVLDLAARHGLNVLPTIVVDHGVVPDDLMYPILTKSISPNVGGWKKDVHICNNAKELKEAYSRILSPRVLIQRYLDKKNESKKVTNDTYESIYSKDNLLTNNEDIESMDKEEETTEEPGAAVLTNGSTLSSYMVQAKLNREQTRSKNKETLLEVINNNDIGDKEKKKAVKSMVKITENSEMENNIETLLKAKGFNDIIVTINDNQADVILSDTEVSDEKRAQIEDVIKRKTNISVNNIPITPAK